MGCTTSKQARRDLRRRPSLSVPVDHRHPHPAAAAHLAALPRCTDEDKSNHSFSDEHMKKTANDRSCRAMKPPLPPQPAVVLRTPTVTPRNEPQIINTWELMEGLEDTSPFLPSSAGVARPSFSTSGGGSADFDPAIISAFRSALAELTPIQPFYLRCSPARQRSPDLTGIVKARVRVFQDRIDAKRSSTGSTSVTLLATGGWPPGGERRVVIYVTTLRGVRETFEDCCYARTILNGYGVRIDERDASMHAAFVDELDDLLNDHENNNNDDINSDNNIYNVNYNNSDELGQRRRRRWRLPEVFANGSHIGGAEEVKRMHETGELAAALEGCVKAGTGVDGGGGCEGCGGVRFTMCRSCSGSCKVFVEEEGKDAAGGEFRRCKECNEYGLVKCSLCW